MWVYNQPGIGGRRLLLHLCPIWIIVGHRTGSARSEEGTTVQIFGEKLCRSYGGKN